MQIAQKPCHFLNVSFCEDKLAVIAVSRPGSTSNILMVPFSRGAAPPTKYPSLWEVDQNLLNESVCKRIWRKDRLRFYRERHETQGNLKYGERSDHDVSKTDFYGSVMTFRLSFTSYHAFEPTGVVKGKSDRNVVYRLFLEKRIDGNFHRERFLRWTRE